MIFLICRKAETADELTVVIFERDEFKLTVKGVPARLCPSCGEAYLEEATADQVLSLARQCFQDGSLETEREFGTF